MFSRENRVYGDMHYGRPEWACMDAGESAVQSVNETYLLKWQLSFRNSGQDQYHTLSPCGSRSCLVQLQKIYQLSSIRRWYASHWKYCHTFSLGQLTYSVTASLYVFVSPKWIDSNIRNIQLKINFVKQEHSETAHSAKAKIWSGMRIRISELIWIRVRVSAESVPRCSGFILLSARVLSLIRIYWWLYDKIHLLKSRPYSLHNGEKNEKWSRIRIRDRITTKS